VRILVFGSLLPRLLACSSFLTNGRRDARWKQTEVAVPCSLLFPILLFCFFAFLLFCFFGALLCPRRHAVSFRHFFWLSVVLAHQFALAVPGPEGGQTPHGWLVGSPHPPFLFTSTIPLSDLHRRVVLDAGRLTLDAGRLPSLDRWLL
jgi:hypothetical protein